ncbi:MAG TPA: alpha/beta fold hydrolase, partial [Thermoplasmata archaeon]|nr:alpha/beta fold hydrolase [Thermoplasmata archaeon]
MASPPPVPVELHRRDEGSGETILLVHGLGGDHALWNPVIASLAPDFRVIAPDLRGHGRSEAPPGSAFSFAELSGDLLHLLDELGVNQVHLVGLSAGAFLGLQLALQQPARLKSLVVIGAATHCDNHTRAIADRWISTYQKEGFDAYVLRLLKDLYYPDWIEAHLDVADALRAQQEHEHGRGVLEWGKAIRSYDLRGRLGRITVPTLIVQAVDDQVIDPAHGRLLRQSIPGSELKLFAQTGHLVPVERPRETTEAIREWV